MLDPLELVQDAPDSLGQLFLKAIKKRDKKGLNQLIQGNPHVLWGKYTKTLIPEDNEWALNNLDLN